MFYVIKDEDVYYVDLMLDGQYCQYILIQEVKSVVIMFSGGQVLFDKGFYSINGLVWFGCGCIRKVDVFVDGGCNWCEVQLQVLVMDCCLICFSLFWIWDGKFVLVMSCVMDEIGQVQVIY